LQNAWPAKQTYFVGRASYVVAPWLGLCVKFHLRHERTTGQTPRIEFEVGAY